MEEEKIKQALLQIPKEHYISNYSEGEVSDTIHIMTINGTAYCRIYWFRDDNTTVYLSELNVSDIERECGVGLTLQVLREQIGIIMGANKSCLWVDKTKWMYEWYKRRGYIEYTDHKTEKNAVWMKKDLKKNHEKIKELLNKKQANEAN